MGRSALSSSERTVLQKFIASLAQVCLLVLSPESTSIGSVGGPEMREADNPIMIREILFAATACRACSNESSTRLLWPTASRSRASERADLDSSPMMRIRSGDRTDSDIRYSLGELEIRSK